MLVFPRPSLIVVKNCLVKSNKRRQLTVILALTDKVMCDYMQQQQQQQQQQ